MKRIQLKLLALGLLALSGQKLFAQGDHIYTGVLPSGQLYFDNGAAFLASAGYPGRTLSYSSTGVYAGYDNGSLTFPVQPATAAPEGAAAADAPPLGSYIELAIVSVTGPAGGKFGFWEAGATQPTFSYNVGYQVAVPTQLWNISDPTAGYGAGQVGGDPYGHIHGRRFTATEDGTYTVGFETVDISGQASHSDVLYIQFNATGAAVPEPAEYAAVAGLALAGFAAWRRRSVRA
jgi:MYXO-CTERM domain-containing protein